MKTTTRLGHARRIDAVVTHLQQALERSDEVPDLQTLAGIAHLSPFHFHRVWRALTGEPLGRTVARLRLSRALQLLSDPRAAIGTVAQAAGYDTQQAFARAFRDALGASPGQVRGDPARIARAAERLAAPRGAVAEGAGAALQVEVVSLAPFEVVALRNQGAFADLDAAYGRLFAWAADAGVVESVESLHGLPGGDHRDVPAGELVFDCAIRLSAPIAPAAPMRRLRVGGGMYARARHVGAYEALEGLVDRLLGHWWPGSGLALREAPIHYDFLDDPEVVPEALLRADVFVPVAARGPE